MDARLNESDVPLSPPLSTQASNTKDLPIDVIYEILIRLPVKALVRLKCVSKSWYYLISHPSFHKDHYLFRSKENPNLVIVTESVTQYGEEFSHLTFSTYTNDFTMLTNFSVTAPRLSERPGCTSCLLEPIGSCLGLVCIASRHERNILVCNPSTQEIITLPPPPTQGTDKSIGFGYADSSEEHRVVVFYRPGDYYDEDEELFCVIFTLGSKDSWRKTTSPPFLPAWRPTLFHGALHLMPDYHHVDGDNYIAAFDIEAETYRRVPLPEIYFRAAESIGVMHLVELRGTLCLAFNYFGLELWFLNEYSNGKWEKEYQIDFTSTYSDGPGVVLLQLWVMEASCYLSTTSDMSCVGTTLKRNVLHGLRYMTQLNIVLPHYF